MSVITKKCASESVFGSKWDAFQVCGMWVIIMMVQI